MTSGYVNTYVSRLNPQHIIYRMFQGESAILWENSL
jgi:hypothetical protein